MIGTVLTIAVGFVAGAGISGGLVYAWMRRRREDIRVIDSLTDADRDEVARDFAVHVHSVQRKVSEFADALADGDEDLRDRLRHFERGGRQ